jgi:uncharacterized membrane protein YidH (DUF202 family)
VLLLVRPTERMDVRTAIAVVANFLLIGGLVVSGFALFAEYHARGRWAKNVTALLAGLGMLTLAFALMITPQNAEVITRIATTKASSVFLWVSSAFLLVAIAAFGIITYAKPFRLQHERKIGRDLNRELPKVP